MQIKGVPAHPSQYIIELWLYILLNCILKNDLALDLNIQGCQQVPAAGRFHRLLRQFRRLLFQKKKTKKEKLDCYSCKQLLKDSSLTFNDLEGQHTLISLCFKDKSLRTEKVN